MDGTRFDTACSQLADQVTHEASKGLARSGDALTICGRDRGLCLGLPGRWARPWVRYRRVWASLSPRLRAGCGRGRSERLSVPSVEPGFRSVAIVPSNEAQRPAGMPQLRLITSDGHIVEGLDLESAAYLLKALR